MTTTTALLQRVSDQAFRASTLGAPGVYFVPATPARSLDVEPMDVAAFVGIAPRGPAWETTSDPGVYEGNPFRARGIGSPVDSWDDYVELYGGYDGPGLLAHAVAAYFAQGGRRAYIVRVVPHQDRPPTTYETPPGCTELEVGLPGEPPWLSIAARNEGSWGDRLAVIVRFTFRRIQLRGGTDPLVPLGRPPDLPDGWAVLAVPALSMIVPGATLRLNPPQPRPDPNGQLGTPSAKPSYWIVRQMTPGKDGRVSPASTVLTLEPVHANQVTYGTLATRSPIPGANSVAWTIDVVEADLVIDGHDPDRPRQETFSALGLDAMHPRNLPLVVNAQSRLIQIPQATWSAPSCAALVAGELASTTVTPGADSWDLLDLPDLFPCGSEPDWTGGVGVVGRLDEVATIVVPDLYLPSELTQPVPRPDPAPTPTTFVDCPAATVQPSPVQPKRVQPYPVQPHPVQPGSAGSLLLDPTYPDDLLSILKQQAQLISWAEQLRCVALVDVPLGLTTAQILQWRAALGSNFAAAYHPWLVVPTGPDGVRVLPPSAVAAGIIADSERRGGIARGPANELANDVVDVAAVVTSDDHATLHRLGVDVFQIDLDGIRLTSARTLSADPAWRQLSVRRLLLAIERTVRHQLQWTVFEPNDDRLRDALRRQLNGLLEGLFEQGCFAGATPAQSWFVAIADKASARAEADTGQVLVQIGVAPIEPMEFIIVQVAVQAEGTITTVTSAEPTTVLSRAVNLGV